MLSRQRTSAASREAGSSECGELRKNERGRGSVWRVARWRTEVRRSQGIVYQCSCIFVNSETGRSWRVLLGFLEGVRGAVGVSHAGCRRERARDGEPRGRFLWLERPKWRPELASSRGGTTESTESSREGRFGNPGLHGGGGVVGRRDAESTKEGKHEKGGRGGGRRRRTGESSPIRLERTVIAADSH